jgi:hypothetical protein
VLSKTDQGIWNYYSPLDAPLCIVGTTVLGTVDGVHSPAAGAVGFFANGQDVADRGPQLHQVPFHPRMLLSLNWGGHFGWCSQPFAQSYLAPVVQSASRQSAATLIR